VRLWEQWNKGLGERDRKTPEGLAAERGTTMINNISEGVLRVASKIDPSSVIHEKEVSQQKAKEIRDARPVEKSEGSAQAQAKKSPKEKGTEKFLFEDKHMVFEKYDKNGDLILRLPPSEKPVDQIV
jgi:hypothetical protein